MLVNKPPRLLQLNKASLLSWCHDPFIIALQIGRDNAYRMKDRMSRKAYFSTRAERPEAQKALALHYCGGSEGQGAENQPARCMKAKRARERKIGRLQLSGS